VSREEVSDSWYHGSYGWGDCKIHQWEYFRDDKRTFAIKRDDGAHEAFLFVARHLERDVLASEKQREVAMQKASHALLDNPYDAIKLKAMLREEVKAAICQRRSGLAEEERSRRRIPLGVFKFDILREAQAKIGLENMGVVDHQWRIFSIDQARQSRNPLQIQGRLITKFLVSKVCGVFQCATENVVQGVMLQKVVNPNVPCGFHLDVELDACAGDKLDVCALDRYVLAVEDWIDTVGLGEDLELDGATVKALADERVVSLYTAIVLSDTRKEFTNAECAGGCTIVNAFIRDHLDEHIPEMEGRVDLRIVTGCCPKFFLIHLVEKRLFFDSNVASLPIFVFFMCRKFSWHNLREVLIALGDLPEGSDVDVDDVDDALKFWLRAMRLEKGCRPQNCDGLLCKFLGFNDTPVDEVVYIQRTMAFGRWVW
jgi:hypothetical protein